MTGVLLPDTDDGKSAVVKVNLGFETFDVTTVGAFDVEYSVSCKVCALGVSCLLPFRSFDFFLRMLGLRETSGISNDGSINGIKIILAGFDKYSLTSPVLLEKER